MLCLHGVAVSASHSLWALIHNGLYHWLRRSLSYKIISPKLLTYEKKKPKKVSTLKKRQQIKSAATMIHHNGF